METAHLIFTVDHAGDEAGVLVETAGMSQVGLFREAELMAASFDDRESRPRLLNSIALTALEVEDFHIDYELQATKILNAEGIDATYQNTGGGCMVAEVLLFDGEAEVDDGPHIMVTATEDDERVGKWMIGLYEEWGAEGVYAFADTDETMVKAVRAFMDR